MGVHGLWKLLEPSGQMVPLESLAGKVLAVDISIWLHQAVKGMHDAHGAPVAVAHLLILFHRLCKLLFYKIKPVFVFDGGVPSLKSQTMAARRQRSTAAKSEALKVREKLIKNLLRHEAVRQVLSDETASAALGLNSFTLPGPSVEEDLYKLPPMAADCGESEGSEGASSGEEEAAEDIHSVDVTSGEFLSLPAEVRHEILTELMETRKQSSWKYLETMPKQSDSFSDFQMSRLLKRHAVQTSLEKAGKEMGGRALSMKELESLLGEQGVLDPKAEVGGRRIAQDSTTRYVLVQRGGEGEGKGGKFDVMEHLEEVEWSSESDTEVILDRRKGGGGGREECGGVSGGVGTSEEVAGILSILEDSTADAEVRVESHCDLNSESLGGVRGGSSDAGGGGVCAEEKFVPSTAEPPDKTPTREFPVPEDTESDQTVKRNKMETEKAPEPQEKTPPREVTVPESDQTIQRNKIETEKASVPLEETPPPLSVPEGTESDETIKRTDKMETEKAVDPQEITPPQVSSVPEGTDETPERRNKMETEKAPEASNLTPPQELPTPEATKSSQTPEGTNIQPDRELESDVQQPLSGDSSDSESDFIPITPAEMECVLPPTADPQQTPPPTAAPPPHSLTVVINPSHLSQKDDLFADVFQQDEGRPEFGGGVSAEELSKALQEEQSALMKEKGKQERHAMNLTDQIYVDAQELLRLFGVPFVVAPMEAEAQCAALNLLGLTEGTITDDSDIWLFGGRVVYKNFFNQNKHVVEYRSEEIARRLKLTREEMIKVALLVGSDYTVGLSGIGPVTALEIIASFQVPNGGALESLVRFREWFTGAAKGGATRATLRRKMRNTVMTPGFPSRAVVEAYLHPQVDDSKEPFSWAKPNLDLIRKYVRAKMGWSAEKCNDLLLPVLKKLEEKSSQTTIDKHFRMAQKSAAGDLMLSKRVENAIKRLGNSSAEAEEVVDDPKPRKKRKPNNESGPGRPPPQEASQSAKGPKAREAKPSAKEEMAKLKLIRDKLHQIARVPQREMAQKLQEEKKKEAIRIFRTFGKPGKKKKKVFAKEEANLSESSSEGD